MLIDQLLSSPHYGEHVANRWHRLLTGGDKRPLLTGMDKQELEFFYDRKMDELGPGKGLFLGVESEEILWISGLLMEVFFA